MSAMSDKYPLKVEMSDKAQKHYERITALLNLENFCTAIDFSRELALKCAEGVVEWLTPLVLTESVNSRLKMEND